MVQSDAPCSIRQVGLLADLLQYLLLEILVVRVAEERSAAVILGLAGDFRTLGSILVSLGLPVGRIFVEAKRLLDHCSWSILSPTHIDSVIGAHSCVTSLVVLTMLGPASLQLVVRLLVGPAREAVILVAL